MCITVEWANEDHNVVLYRVEAPWTWEDTERAKQLYQQMTVAIDHKVNCIFDVRAIGTLPRNTLQVIVEYYSALPANAGIYAVVGAPTMLKAVMDVLRVMRPNVFSRYQTVNDFEDAYRLMGLRQSRVY
jgi:hypothetical protein